MAKFWEISSRECVEIFYGDLFGEDFVQGGMDEGSGPDSHTLGSLGPAFFAYKTQRGLQAGGGRAGGRRIRGESGLAGSSFHP